MKFEIKKEFTNGHGDILTMKSLITIRDKKDTSNVIGRFVEVFENEKRYNINELKPVK